MFHWNEIIPIWRTILRSATVMGTSTSSVTGTYCRTITWKPLIAKRLTTFGKAPTCKQWGKGMTGNQAGSPSKHESPYRAYQTKQKIQLPKQIAPPQSLTDIKHDMFALAMSYRILDTTQTYRRHINVTSRALNSPITDFPRAPSRAPCTDAWIQFDASREISSDCYGAQYQSLLVCCCVVLWWVTNLYDSMLKRMLMSFTKVVIRHRGF